MICLPSNLPLLRVGDHETSDYQPQWLIEVLRQAACGAGHPHWQHHTDITSAVFTWLERSHPGAVVTLDELFDRLATALRETGYPTVADRLAVTSPPLAVHLPELARDGFGELTFFTKLEKRLQPLATGVVRTLVCTGLAEAALLLSPPAVLGKRRKPARSPREIGHDITGFIHQRCSQLSPAQVPTIWFPGIDPPETAAVVPIGSAEAPLTQPLAC